MPLLPANEFRFIRPYIYNQYMPRAQSTVRNHTLKVKYINNTNRTLSTRQHGESSIVDGSIIHQGRASNSIPTCNSLMGNTIDKTSSRKISFCSSIRKQNIKYPYGYKK